MIINRSSINTPLTVACINKNEEIVKLIIESATDVNKKDELRQTPLTIAYDLNNKNIIKLLIENGANVNGEGRYKITPLFIACEKKK